MECRQKLDRQLSSRRRGKTERPRRSRSITPVPTPRRGDDRKLQREAGGLETPPEREQLRRDRMPGRRRARRSSRCFVVETTQQFAKAIGKRLTEDLIIESAQLRSNSPPDFIPTRRSRMQFKSLLGGLRNLRLPWGARTKGIDLDRIGGRQFSDGVVALQRCPRASGF
jgi:hypothetical protein